MMPLFTTLETALISGLDHGASAWKHLYALPIPRWTIYAAKQIISLALIGGSMLVMAIGIWLTGTFVHVTGLKPNLDFGTPFPWSTVLTLTLLGFLASWLIISIHVWVSMRWPNFTISLGVGIVAVVGAFVVVNSDEFRPFYPWTFRLIPISSICSRIR
jgi:ABC-2 type transport system permease protein